MGMIGYRNGETCIPSNINTHVSVRLTGNISPLPSIGMMSGITDRIDQKGNGKGVFLTYCLKGEEMCALVCDLCVLLKEVALTRRLRLEAQLTNGYAYKQENPCADEQCS